MPKRVLFDTNVYGFLTGETISKIDELVLNKFISVYGCSVVRKELRNTSKSALKSGKSVRNRLLSMYDSYVPEKRNYLVGSPSISLAEEYWQEFTGNGKKKNIMNDFLIAATSSIHSLDILVTEDIKTMSSVEAINSYKIVNEGLNFRTPKFMKIIELIQF